jgi:hypothetical protein
MMTKVSSMDRNERGCFLLSEGKFSEGLVEFKKALSALKSEIKEWSRDLHPTDNPRKPLCQELEVTPRTTGEYFSLLIPTTKAYKEEYESFWIFSHPLAMERVTGGSELGMYCNSDAFTISFNVALASHLHGVEQALEGSNDHARHSFMVAMKMYNLTLCQANYNRHGGEFNTLNGHLIAAIFSNLSHVHVMLGETIHSTLFAEQLLKTLFYLVVSGRVISPQDAATHKLLLENAYCRLMAPLNSAAAA